MDDRSDQPPLVAEDSATPAALAMLVRDALAVILLDVCTCESWLQSASLAEPDLESIFRRMRSAVHRAAAATELAEALEDARQRRAASLVRP